METRKINEQYEQLAREVISETESLFPIKDLKIIYLESDHAKKHGDKIVMGECEKVPSKYQWAIPADFTITLYLPNIRDLNEDQMKILLHHELLHAGEDGKIVKHDIEDFREIINTYGTDWAEQKS